MTLNTCRRVSDASHRTLAASLRDLYGSRAERQVMQLADHPRFCVWCGQKVPVDSERSLCSGHRQLADEIDRRVNRHVDVYETPPLGIPVQRDA